MKIKFAHPRERARSGGWINFAVFDVRSSSGTSADNSQLIAQLTLEPEQRSSGGRPSCPSFHERWAAKRDIGNGRFMEQKKGGDPFKGVRKEKRN
ncbi:hypothetical protein E6O51_14140 [Pseudothauera rhizosphaerae]|uniref:Uncharacterized protein n=1 Tax=Pseudothauera rhizosphaerae TaxID=2565932 RepID=A0A4S4AMQ7_9RHOO|nr:hypothetical protein E6O51_14140 [Pseudothauera rhizosphaerae]